MLRLPTGSHKRAEEHCVHYRRITTMSLRELFHTSHAFLWNYGRLQFVEPPIIDVNISRLLMGIRKNQSS